MAEGKSISRVIVDKVLLLGLAVVILAPIVAGFVLLAPGHTGMVTSHAELEDVSDEEELVVSRNLGDDALGELARLKNLRELQLHYSDITDVGMKRVGACGTLHKLVLTAEHVTDGGLAHLGNLKLLQELILAGMPAITDDGLACLAELPELRRLSIIRCPGIGPHLGKKLAGLKLEFLDLEQCRAVGDEAATGIAKLLDLKHLNLNFCEALGDEGIGQLAALPNLEVLTLHGVSRMSDVALTAIARLKSLKVLHLPLHTAPISSAGIEKLKAALPGCEINR
ncbi:MAG: hypothetical protein IPK87_03995 [Planctomycetes bacterium]|nr:hypothetical protein [Planctomycetota bacterium]